MNDSSCLKWNFICTIRSGRFKKLIRTPSCFGFRNWGVKVSHFRCLISASQPRKLVDFVRNHAFIVQPCCIPLVPICGLIEPAEGVGPVAGDLECQEQLGGMLKNYHRRATEPRIGRLWMMSGCGEDASLVRVDFVFNPCDGSRSCRSR